LSGNRVISDMWNGAGPMDHISWGQETDLIIIAPATANVIGKIAAGIGDDFLTTMVLAAKADILLCPAMNTRMFQNPAVQENLLRLKDRGYTVMAPGEGELACGTEGPGRLPDPGDIADLAGMLLREKDLSGMRILITAGPTREPIDPVRFLSNRSSGKMGYALARAAHRRGSDVILISGPTALKPPPGLSVVSVETAEEMKTAVFEHCNQQDVIIKAAAVSDYRPDERSGKKIKKQEGGRHLRLERNPDILAELGERRGETSCILVGFAAETEDLLENAAEKLRRKNLDMIVANDVSRDDAGFQVDTNMVRILFRDGHREELPLMTKDALADHLLDRVKGLWKQRT
ncbi:MAG: bifunctional phosphopantothenoylcysteine decarboxylase/phosphopantothenate--cysteine ligase CoaBC, partial [Deltaproteobacteria bacterium]|nr:bifunctional phosphopantothenoylcysteine decarboxylase/phosphopantothenate--cysteine ligase CoaBC [Deltaproteobacteria bacterium]